MVRAALLLFFCSALLAAKTQIRTGDGESSNASASLEATIYADPESVRQAVGDDLGNHYIVVRVKLSPKSGKLPVQLDDFLLKTDKDGERSHPFAPTQIAGQGALVVSQTVTGGGGSHAEDPDPRWRMGMPGGGGFGNAASTIGAKAKMQQDEKENPLVHTLAGKMLPEKETGETVTGLLYFPMEKQRVKDLELIYTTPSGKLSVRFR
ncbi:MAG: hypothetical protein M3Z09_12390 [Acidobacteriota bacterium]|nr:hypothetical protein [Acidobacteriota bacterium]